jgi:hypothetical protein
VPISDTVRDAPAALGANALSRDPESIEIDPRPPSVRSPKIDLESVCHVLILLLVSIGFESLFLHYNLNSMDEGWPLHAAMELHNGGTLYDDVFWVFPPGHVLPAWIGYGLAAPGIIATRIIYAIFSVATSLGFYFVARRLMPSDFALLAGLLIAVAAPRSHWEQLLFGYRYLALCAGVLLCFHRALSADLGEGPARNRSRWLFGAGLLAGIALFFRVTPAFAVCAAVGVGIVAASRDWRRWLRDGLLFAAGLILVWIPLLIWLQTSVGLERFWIEAIVRPVEMTALQTHPLPPLNLPDTSRLALLNFIAAVGFRAYPILYLGFAVVLLVQWARAVLDHRPFESVFLLTFVVFGGVYFLRSMGRSDLPHLDSAIPPVLVLISYVASLATRRPSFRVESAGRIATLRRAGLCAGLLALWIYANGADQFLDQEGMMGSTPVLGLEDTLHVTARSEAAVLNHLVPIIQKHARPDDRVLVMSNRPIIHVLAERRSPGYHDVVMPGTFRSRREEETFLARIEADPPAVIVWPRRHFDRRKDRGLEASAPLLSHWIIDHYRVVATLPLFKVLVPKSTGSDPDADPDADGDVAVDEEPGTPVDAKTDSN